MAALQVAFLGAIYVMSLIDACYARTTCLANVTRGATTPRHAIGPFSDVNFPTLQQVVQAGQTLSRCESELPMVSFNFA
jgi:hypothetical protein